MLTLAPGYAQLEVDWPEQTVPLRPWRADRTYVELRQLVEGQTIAPLLMCRFACLADGQTMPLSALLYREFDLAEWLGGSSIAGIHAAIYGSSAANVILKLSNEVVW